jgi:hypothetical protein
MKANEWRVSQCSFPAQRGTKFLLVSPEQFDQALQEYGDLRASLALDERKEGTTA